MDRKQAPARKPAQAARQIRVIAVQNGPVNKQINIQGRLTAKERIELFAEVQGVMQPGSQAFRAGTKFKKGDLIISIDKTEAEAAIVAQRSQFINSISQVLPDIQLDYVEEASAWKKYLQQLNAQSPLPSPPETTNETFELFLTARGIPTAYFNLQSAEVRFDKYSIKAPYDGILVDAFIREGSLIRPGQALGTFIKEGEFELEASVEPSDLNYLKEGIRCQLSSTDIDGSWNSTLTRINRRIDPGTQTVRIYFDLKSKDLKEGMYLKGNLPSLSIDNAFAISRRLLVNDRFVFAVQDTLLKRLEPEIKGFSGDVAILSGIPNGTQLMADAIPGAYDGMVVQLAKEED